MSLPHALLTALAEHACSGSELASRFDRSIGYFWHATHQQIYRELGRLEDAGWVQSTPILHSRGRKRTYCILPAGREELRRWIAEPEDPTPPREELLVRLRAEAAVGPAGLEEEIERRLRLHEQKLEFYQSIEARDFSGHVDTRERQLKLLVLKAGIMHEASWVAFSKDALRVLATAASK